MLRTDDYRIRNIVKPSFIVLAIIGALIIEYIMIIEQVYPNFPSPAQSIQLYLVMTIIVLVLYHVIWHVEYTILLGMWFKSVRYIYGNPRGEYPNLNMHHACCADDCVEKEEER